MKALVFAVLALVVGLAANTAVASTTDESGSETEAPADTTDTGSTETESTETTEAETAPETTEPETEAETEPETTETTSPPESTEPETTETTEPETTEPETPDTTAPSAAPGDEAERDRIEAAESAKAQEVDAANAQLSELTGALAVLAQDVESQAAELEIATRRLQTAETDIAAAEEDVRDLEATVVRLEIGLEEQAIRSFRSGALEGIGIELSQDLNRSIRMQAMLAKATESDVDFVNELATVREDLLGRRSDAERAAATAQEIRVESEAELSALEQDQQAQLALASRAHDRLDHLLSERAALAQLGAEYDQGGAEQALVAQLASSPAPAAPSTPIPVPTDVVDRSEIVVAAKGIEVHVSIVENIRQLLSDAAADGVDLAGGGYRDSAGQIAARRNNCGTSTYAIYEMPSSQCSPPTARPGRSQHERGLAIDFTYNGSLIRTRSGGGWLWLQANASRYGLFNLPSEPWHWSTTGR